jgi:hypothetical protein
MMEAILDLEPRGCAVSVDRMGSTLTLRFQDPQGLGSSLAVRLDLAQARDALEGLASCLAKEMGATRNAQRTTPGQQEEVPK